MCMPDSEYAPNLWSRQLRASKCAFCSRILLKIIKSSIIVSLTKIYEYNNLKPQTIQFHA